MEPRLPLDLEREIFELCAFADPVAAKSLMLVCKRVHQWTESLLYRVLLYYYGPVRTRPCTKAVLDYNKQRVITPRLRTVCSYAHRVLLQSMPTSSVMELLGLCTNAREIAIWVMGDGKEYPLLREIIPVVGAPVTRLSINTSQLFATSDGFRFEASVLRHITHLDAIAVCEEFWRTECHNLGLLPELTHLAFANDGSMHKSIVEAILSDTLGFRKLRVLVLFVYGEQRNWPKKHYPFMEDERYVELEHIAKPIEDWIHGAQTGYDFWVKAEKVQEDRGKASTTGVLIEGEGGKPKSSIV